MKPEYYQKKYDKQLEQIRKLDGNVGASKFSNNNMLDSRLNALQIDTDTWYDRKYTTYQKTT